MLIQGTAKVEPASTLYWPRTTHSLDSVCLRLLETEAYLSQTPWLLLKSLISLSGRVSHLAKASVELATFQGSSPSTLKLHRVPLHLNHLPDNQMALDSATIVSPFEITTQHSTFPRPVHRQTRHVAQHTFNLRGSTCRGTRQHPPADGIARRPLLYDPSQPESAWQLPLVQRRDTYPSTSSTPTRRDICRVPRFAAQPQI